VAVKEARDTPSYHSLTSSSIELYSSSSSELITGRVTV